MSSGALGRISIQWSVSTGATGYNVYRSSGGGAFSKITSNPVTTLSYDDTLPSPANDGVLFTYQVTATNTVGESARSSSVSNMEGTRVPATSSSGFTTLPGSSPYVVDGTATVDGGDVTVATGSALYLQPGSTLSLPDRATLVVNGLLRAMGTAVAPAVINGHGLAANTLGAGIGLRFEGAVAYNASTGQGTLLDHTLVRDISSGDNRFILTNCAPAFQHCKFQSNDGPGRTYLEFNVGCGARLNRCTATGVVPTVQADLRGQSAFSVTQCSFTGSYYSIYVRSQNTPGLLSGQFSGNSMAGSRDAVIYFVSAASDVPLGGNYWAGGSGTPPLPPINTLGSTNTVTLNFSPALSAVPSPVGSDW